MANHLYAAGAEALLRGQLQLDVQAISLVLLRGYTYSSAHATYLDLGATPVATSATYLTPSFSTGVTPSPYVAYRGSVSTFTAVPAGAAITAAALFVSAATKGGTVYGTSDPNRVLLAYFDTGVGLPVTPDGSDVLFKFGDTTELTDVVFTLPL